MASKKQEGKTGGGSPPRKQDTQSQAQKKDLDMGELKAFISNILDEKFQDMDDKINKIDEKIQKSQQEIMQEMQQSQKMVTKKITDVASGLAGFIMKVETKVDEFKLEVNAKMKNNDHKFFDVDDKMQRVENDIVMMQFRAMEFAIRLRGIREEERQDLRQICAEALAVILKVEPEMVFCKIDKIYRVNSWVARQRQLPRDVVIYFTDRAIRNDILQKSFLTSVQVSGSKITVYKELPPKMLKSRKEYGFLVKELQNNQIPFRWDAPTGIILRYKGEKHRLNTVEKAEQFYNDIFKERTPSPRTSTVLEIKEQQSKQELAELKGAEGGFLDEPLLEPSPISELAWAAEVKDQRITRAKAKELKEKLQQESQDKAGAVGKAGQRISDDILRFCASLQKENKDD